MPRFPRWMSLAFMFQFLLSVGVLIYYLLRSYFAMLAPPPFHYDQPSYIPVKNVLCPGEVLEYEAHIIVNQPAVVARVQVWWDVRANRTAVFDESPEWTIWRNAPFSQTVMSRAIVPTLPPGLYEFRVGRFEAGASPQMHYVTVTIPEDCQP